AEWCRVDIGLARVEQIGKAIIDAGIFDIAMLDDDLAIDAELAATVFEADLVARTCGEADGPDFTALLEPVEAAGEIGLVRLTGLEADVDIHGGLLVGREGQLGALNKDRIRHDLGEDREGIDA